MRGKPWRGRPSSDSCLPGTSLVVLPSSFKSACIGHLFKEAFPKLCFNCHCLPTLFPRPFSNTRNVIDSGWPAPLHQAGADWHREEPGPHVGGPVIQKPAAGRAMPPRPAAPPQPRPRPPGNPGPTGALTRASCRARGLRPRTCRRTSAPPTPAPDSHAWVCTDAAHRPAPPPAPSAAPAAPRKWPRASKVATRRRASTNLRPTKNWSPLRYTRMLLAGVLSTSA